MRVKWVYQTAGYANELDATGRPCGDLVCLFDGARVPFDWLAVHRAGCPMPRPFDAREYSRRLLIRFENLPPLEDDLSPVQLPDRRS